MRKFRWQRSLSRGKRANLIGLALMMLLILVLMASVAQGVRTLAVG